MLASFPYIHYISEALIVGSLSIKYQKTQMQKCCNGLEVWHHCDTVTRSIALQIGKDLSGHHTYAPMQDSRPCLPVLELRKRRKKSDRAGFSLRRSPTRCPARPSNNDSWRSRPPTAASGPSSRSLESTRSQHGLENTIWHRQETPRTKTRRRHAKTCAEIPCGPCSVAVCGSILTQRLLAGSPVPGLRQGRLSPVFIDCGQRGEHFSTDGRAVFASAFLSCDLLASFPELQNWQPRPRILHGGVGMMSSEVLTNL
jgi:hypothetical protein